MDLRSFDRFLNRSLQSKVKKLKEERDLSPRDEEIKEKSDLEKNSKEERLEDGEDDGDGGEPEERLTHRAAGKSVSGEDSDRGNQSCNESNSTGARDEKPNSAGSDEAEEKEREPPVRTGSEEPDPDSHKGSTDTQPGKKAESGDVAAEEEEEEERAEEDVMKENSDVQSSASLTRRRRRRRFGGRRRWQGKKGIAGAGCSSGDEPETDGSHAIIKINSVESEPLTSLLQIIRSHEHSSLFENPPQNQVTILFLSLFFFLLFYNFIILFSTHFNRSTATFNKFYKIERRLIFRINFKSYS